jgi:arylsulfatase A-like enzyme
MTRSARIVNFKISTMCNFLAILALLTSFVMRTSSFAAEPRPNVLFILTDNQGAWSLGCHGNKDIYTPNLDRLAGEGVRFENAFANNPVCSPTRATWLTGLTPSQHGIHRYIDPKLFRGPEARDLLAGRETLHSLFHAAGYETGWIGKCHLGAHTQPRAGIGTWIVKMQGHTTSFYNTEVVFGSEVKKVKEHLTTFWTERAVEFIQKQPRDRSRPFFLYLAYNGPYGLGGCVSEDPPERWKTFYADKPMTHWPRPSAPHPTQRADLKHIGNIRSMRNLAAQISAVDEGVGRVLAALKDANLEQDTLVIFSADQGAVAGHAGFWGMGDHAQPNHLRDGTLKVPLIIRWPGRVSPGTRPQIVSNLDLVPTLRQMLALPAKTPAEKLPGRDLSALLLKNQSPAGEEMLFAEFELARAVRTPRWKYVRRIAVEPAQELYDLAVDPDEMTNLAPQANDEQRKVIAFLDARLTQWFSQHRDKQWDIWNGGGTQGRVMGDLAKYLKTSAPNSKTKRITQQPKPQN